MNNRVVSQSRKIIELEALRGAAALYVFLHHSRLLPNQGLGRFLYFGQEAVITFFLLSGFVIFYSTNKQHLNWLEYLAHRFKRIYPIFVAALVLAYTSQSLIASSWLNIDLSSLISNLLMLQDNAFLKEGVWTNTYYGNSPLWSLSYEWWFYMLFIPLGVIKNNFLSDNNSLIAIAISVAGFIGYQIYPNQICLFLGYFYIWWAGVEFAREFQEKKMLSFSEQKYTLLGLVFMTGLWMIPVVLRLAEKSDLQLGFSPVLQFRHHAAALVFALIGIFISQNKVKIYRFILIPFAWFAPISYAIYLIHKPILDLSHFFLTDLEAWQVCAIAFLATLPIAWLLEIKMQGFINKLYKSNR